MSINPFRENILVKRIDPVEKTAGGLYIPDPSKEKPSEGEVVAVGSTGLFRIPVFESELFGIVPCPFAFLKLVGSSQPD